MTDAPTKLITATIKEITEAQGGKQGTYHKLTTPPVGQQKYPNVYKVWDSKLLEGIKTGDTIILTLQRGRGKIADPQGDNDYYWEVVGVAKVVQDGPWPGDDTVKAPQAPKQPATPSQGNHVAPDAKDKQIARAVALKSSIEDFKGIPHTPQEVIARAEVYNEWLLK